MANNVHWHHHVLRREDGHIMRRALDFEVNVKIKKACLNRTWKRQVEGEGWLENEDALCRE